MYSYHICLFLGHSEDPLGCRNSRSSVQQVPNKAHYEDFLIIKYILSF